MKNKRVKLGVILGLLSMAIATLYAENLPNTDKDTCAGSAGSIEKATCCKKACEKINTSQADIDSCTKDCRAYYPSA